MSNPMRRIRIEKLTLNIGVGKAPEKLDKGLKLLKNITGIAPVKTFTQKRIPAWNLRPGLPIGCKLTLRKGQVNDLLKRLLGAKENRLRESQFDEEGNIAFGIHEYIDIPGVNYDPEVGIMGLEVCVTLERLGYRIRRKRLHGAKIPKKHKVTKQDAMEFMQKEFMVKVGEAA